MKQYSTHLEEAININEIPIIKYSDQVLKLETLENLIELYMDLEEDQLYDEPGKRKAALLSGRSNQNDMLIIGDKLHYRSSFYGIYMLVDEIEN